MSTRGRANTIRAVLEHRGSSNGEVLRAPELEFALSNCLACKACTVECPSNVNMTLLKTELLYAQGKHYGFSLKQRVFSSVDLFGALCCRIPALANWALGSSLVRGALSKLLGLAAARPLPHYTRERFDRWFHRRKGPSASPRGRVLLWDDTFVRYHEPHIGKAAVKVLEAAGFEVVLPVGRKCCGRPAFSQGNLDRVRKLGTQNLALLNAQTEPLPVLFLEPSCFSMFAEDYRELSLPGAEQVASRCFLFEQFLDELLQREPDALKFNPKPSKVVIHAHCHVKSLMNPSFLQRLTARLPQREVKLLDTGCCGMAGAFGMMESKYDLSLKIAEPLLQEVRSQPYGAWILASGTSCRHQIGQLTPVRPRHIAEALAEALA